MLDEPAQGDIDVIHILTRYRIKTNLAIPYVVQIHGRHHDITGQGTQQVVLIAKDQQRYTVQFDPLHQQLQLDFRLVERVRIRRVDHEHDYVHPTAIPTPHATEPSLASDVPDLDVRPVLRDLSHVESNGRYRVLVELLGSQQVDESRLSRILKTHDAHFDLLLPEEVPEP